MLPADARERRKLFFQLVYGADTEPAYFCLGFMLPGRRGMAEEYFVWPDEYEEAEQLIQQKLSTHNIYFCPSLLVNKRRHLDNVLPNARVAHADLDKCHPANMLIKPSFVLETSPNSYQALWTLEPRHPVADVEELSQRIAYFHARQGADKGCWDAVHFLRVPYSYNRKPEYGEGINSPYVQMLVATPKSYELEEFKHYPRTQEFEKLSIPFPETLPQFTAHDILDRYHRLLQPYALLLYDTEPEVGADWSTALWNLLMLCFEAGMTREETYIVADDAKCNKFKRDNRDPSQLWRDVCRAFVRNQKNLALIAPPESEEDQITLLTDSERSEIEDQITFVERYIAWAKTLGDAAWQYHQAGAFVTLSALLSGSVQLPTSFGVMKPNLWFMILADTTLTRKSTAMDIAMDLIETIDSSTILATDGSIEGLMTSLALRTGKPSIFLRDEVSGLFEQFTKKDYYAGMAETLTKLYDGRMQKRILRKESIEVRDPILIFFSGGIKNKVLSILTPDNVASGFIPRFVFITAESDVTRVKPLGPPTSANLGERQTIIDELTELYNYYHVKQTFNLGDDGQMRAEMDRRWDAELSSDAWNLYNRLESDMMRMAIKSEHPDILTPSYDRLCKSGLKAAVLLATARQRAPNTVQVSRTDMLRAMQYVEGWKPHTDAVIAGVGKSTGERELERVLRFVANRPGVSRSHLMQSHHLTARQADHILQTLEQRGVITRTRAGKTEQLFPMSFVQSGVSK